MKIRTIWVVAYDPNSIFNPPKFWAFENFNGAIEHIVNWWNENWGEENEKPITFDDIFNDLILLQNNVFVSDPFYIQETKIEFNKE